MSDSPEEVAQKLSEDNAILHLHIDDNSNPMVVVKVPVMWDRIFGTEDGFDTDPAVWGVLTATMVYHMAAAHHGALTRLYKQADMGEPPSEAEILMRIEEVLIKELGDPKFASSFQGWSHTPNEDKH